MLLLIDAGNTRIKWALTAATDVPLVRESLRKSVRDTAESWSASGAVARADSAQLTAVWRTACAAGVLRRVLISNVAGAAVGAQLQYALPPSDQPLQVEYLASQASLGGLCNQYKNPAQLGSDRFAAAIAAHALLPGQALIVATCGTATTIDAVTPDGCFIGGMILPGLGLMANSLALHTAQLPQVSHTDAASSLFADNTQQAIISGCIAAQTGAIERAVREHQQRYGSVTCILTGGAGIYLDAHLAVAHERLDNLVLIGLHVLARSYSTLC